MTIHRLSPARAALLACAFTLCAGAASAETDMPGQVKLVGAQEVPPVDTKAAGSGTITIAPDGKVMGSVRTTGIAGTMAHIHTGQVGQNGPPIVTLTKNGDVWSVPENAKLTDDQVKAYRAGGLYVNVHSDAHKGGEIRAQLTAQP